jgi:hypothetical protein
MRLQDVTERDIITYDSAYAAIRTITPGDAAFGDPEYSNRVDAIHSELVHAYDSIDFYGEIAVLDAPGVKYSKTVNPEFPDSLLPALPERHRKGFLAWKLGEVTLPETVSIRDYESKEARLEFMQRAVDQAHEICRHLQSQEHGGRMIYGWDINIQDPVDIKVGGTGISVEDACRAIAPETKRWSYSDYRNSHPCFNFMLYSSGVVRDILATSPFPKEEWIDLSMDTYMARFHELSLRQMELDDICRKASIRIGVTPGEEAARLGVAQDEIMQEVRDVTLQLLNAAYSHRSMAI